MSDRPTISILMPVYNGARYLREAVESLRAQTFGDFEIIAVDDGSTDNSGAILQKLAQTDPRIRIISRPNTGIVGALNDGLAVARGEFVARMDGDDIAHPERLAVQLSHLRAHPELVAIGCGVRMVDPAGRALKNFTVCTDAPTLRRELIEAKTIGIIHPTLFVRRSVLERVGGYRSQYNFVEDIDLFLRLLDEGDLGNAPDILLDYRQHLQSTNSTRHEKQHPLMAQCYAEHRERWNLPPLETLPKHPPMAVHGAQNILWAYWAVEGGNSRTALRHALTAMIRSKLAPEARRCFNYVIHTLYAL